MWVRMNCKRYYQLRNKAKTIFFSVKTGCQNSGTDYRWYRGPSLDGIRSIKRANTCTRSPPFNACTLSRFFKSVRAISNNCQGRDQFVWRFGKSISANQRRKGWGNSRGFSTAGPFCKVGWTCRYMISENLPTDFVILPCPLREEKLQEIWRRWGNESTGSITVDRYGHFSLDGQTWILIIWLEAQDFTWGARTLRLCDWSGIFRLWKMVVRPAQIQLGAMISRDCSATLTHQ